MVCLATSDYPSSDRFFSPPASASSTPEPSRLPRPRTSSSPTPTTTTTFRVVLVLVVMTSLLHVTSGAILRRSVSVGRNTSPHHREAMRTGTDCDDDLHLSAVCYHCGALDRDTFQQVHNYCCTNHGVYRLECEFMFTEDPKRDGARAVWYYWFQPVVTAHSSNHGQSQIDYLHDPNGTDQPVESNEDIHLSSIIFFTHARSSLTLHTFDKSELFF